MNKRVLFLTDMFYPNYSANGLCIEKLAREFISKGYKVYVVCFNQNKEKTYEKYKNINIYRSSPRLFFKLRFIYERNMGSALFNYLWILARIFNKIQLIVHFYFYPLASFFSANRYYKLVNNLENKFHFDLVISQYIPIDSVYSALKLKKRYPDINICFYIVDTFTNSWKHKKYPILKKLSFRWEKQMFKSKSIVYFMNCHKNHHSKPLYKQYSKNIRYLDIPFCNFNIATPKYNFFLQSNSNIKLCFSGNMGFHEEFIDFCKDITFYNRSHSTVEIWITGKSNSTVQFLLKNFSFIKYSGFIDEEKLNSLMYNVDGFINIGSISDMIPSKLFTYFSYGYPIIHIRKQEKDPCYPYLIKYNKYLLYDKSLYNKLEQFLNFLKSGNTKKSNCCINEFIENTAYYSVNRILEDHLIDE